MNLILFYLYHITLISFNQNAMKNDISFHYQKWTSKDDNYNVLIENDFSTIKRHSLKA